MIREVCGGFFSLFLSLKQNKEQQQKKKKKNKKKKLNEKFLKKEIVEIQELLKVNIVYLFE